MGYGLLWGNDGRRQDFHLFVEKRDFWREINDLVSVSAAIIIKSCYPRKSFLGWCMALKALGWSDVQKLQYPVKSYFSFSFYNGYVTSL